MLSLTEAQKWLDDAPKRRLESVMRTVDEYLWAALEKGELGADVHVGFVDDPAILTEAMRRIEAAGWKVTAMDPTGPILHVRKPATREHAG